jgi:hypothetical protein
MERVITKYLSDKNVIDPLTNEKLSKFRRIKYMYNIIQNNVYGVKYTKYEQLLASRLITDILEEND